MRFFDIKKAGIVVLTIIALGFVFSDFVVDFDYKIHDMLADLITPTGLQFFGFIAFLGDKYFVGFCALVLSYYLWKLPLSGPSFLRIFWFTFTMDVGTGVLLKYVVGRDRPLGAEIYEGLTYSFPSGHAIASIMFYGFLAVMVLKFLKIQNNKKYIIISILGCLIFLIGFSRLYLGVHYLSDVLAGYMIGWFWLNLAIYFVKDIQIERKINIVKTIS